MTTQSPPEVVGPLRSRQVPAAVSLHARLLPHGFFVQLGPRFLTRYYRNYLDSPHAFTVAAVDGGRLAGALVGTLDHEEHTSWTAGSLPALAASGVTALLYRPHLLRRFLRTRPRRYARALSRRAVRVVRRRRHPTTVLAGNGTTGEPSGRSPAGQDRIAVLSHVYVDPAYQGSGLGGRLVDAFLTAARDAGADRAELVTLDGDAGAGAFYDARGWTAGRAHRDADGRMFRAYTRTL